jgi:anti-sigma factor RsiW
MRGERTIAEPQAVSDRAVWRRCTELEVAEDEAERFLDLAAFAEDRLDDDERDRVAERVVHDPNAGADVAAARQLARTAAPPGPVPEHVAARACALIGDAAPERGRIVPFPRLRPRLPASAQRMVRWASLAAAMLVASWVGFALGTDSSGLFGQGGQAADEGFLREFLEPSAGFLRDLTGGAQT